MNDEKLIEYIRGGIKSDKDVIEILNWIESSEEHQERYNKLKNLWVLTGFEQFEDTTIHQLVPKSKNHSFSYRNIIIRTAKYAAVLVLSFLLFTLGYKYLNKKQGNDLAYNEVTVPKGEKSIVTLNDGTKIWLNSGTTLRYPIVFDKHERKVFIEGEAYFDVAKNSEQPFIVHAGQLEIKVLGTRFDVCAYLNEDEILATLEEGSIYAKSSATDKGITLAPGKQAIYSRKTKTITQISVQTDLYTLWKENSLRFTNAEFGAVMEKMERWYHVKIIAGRTISLKERYTLTINKESLADILHLLSITNKMKYEIKNDTVFIRKPR